ncbi:beta-glucuronidase [Salibacterium sp. K-3]
MLYPITTATRDKTRLSGYWKASIDLSGKGMAEQWYRTGLPAFFEAPVPASINEFLPEDVPQDFVGDVWYQTEFFAPSGWTAADHSVFLRIGAAAYYADVWLNETKLGVHKGGFLPFEFDVTTLLKHDSENMLIIKVNNELDWTSLPPGEVKEEDGQKKLTQQHDFFHYTGIHREVFLYRTPEQRIEDITVRTDIQDTSGFVQAEVFHTSENGEVRLYIKNESSQSSWTMKNGETLEVENASFWTPEHPFLYTLEAHLIVDGGPSDVYELEIGIRTVHIDDDTFYLNGAPYYLRGFGKHEDFPVKGKAFDEALALKDIKRMKWTGANSFRTSHYPYAEEWLQLADRHGFLVIDEAPAVGMLGQAVPAVGELDGVFTEDKVNQQTLSHHKDIMKQLITRDKNHPSVVMWCVANEASTMEANAYDYFKELTAETRSLDDRPIMNVNLMLIDPGQCVVSPLVDVIGLNLYFGWYSDPGNLEKGKAVLKDHLNAWKQHHHKPVMMTEYGVDTIPGLHKYPPVMFSEEFQVDFLKAYHQTFDELGWLIGEHVWNFADFMTKEGIVRIDGNKKGIFTREREPKSAAFYLQQRWKRQNEGGYLC